MPKFSLQSVEIIPKDIYPQSCIIKVTWDVSLCAQLPEVGPKERNKGLFKIRFSIEDFLGKTIAQINAKKMPMPKNKVWRAAFQEMTNARAIEVITQNVESAKIKEARKAEEA